MGGDAERIVGLYDRHAPMWDKERLRILFERPWLDRFCALIPVGGSILDLGCGGGEPIARYFIEARYELVGADSSPLMIDICKSRFPDQKWVVADMRTLSLDRCFDGILAWDSFFHLTHHDQRRMFRIFRTHAARNAALMFTSGPSHGKAVGTYHGEPLYHASLEPAEYQSLLHEHGFEVVSHVADDPECDRHTVWLARLK